MIRRKTKFSSWHAPDVALIGILLILLAFGALMVYDSSAAVSADLSGGQYSLVLLQLVWVVIGLAAMGFFYFLDYHRLRKLAFPFFALTIVLLVLALLPTPLSGEVRGAKSWLSIPFNFPFLGKVGIQPSELSKLALVIYLAALFTRQRGSKSSEERPRLWSFLIPTGLVLGLILLEPDLGTAVVVGALGFSIFFLAGGALWQTLLLIPIGLAGGAALVLADPSRLDRIKAFLDPNADPLGIRYQIRQILIALGSGGIFGLGVGESRQKFGWIPDVSTDAIFAIVGEEFGFAGASAVIILFALVVIRSFTVARDAPDDFGRVLAASIGAWVALQVLVNLGAVTGLIPLTGIPLPLISYGGSSLVVLLASFGVLLNVSRQTKRGARSRGGMKRRRRR
ncbi:MAG: stage V sporulation protein E [Patescibacteria group bacterium]|nr:MAG: stage V sporulation protein E [Patescibacteria group bacterium]